MKQSSVNTRFFNFRLFLEALKRLRVIGIGTAILALTVSVLVPVTTWIERNSSISLDVYTVDTQRLCIPVGLVVFLAPLFFFVLFSFLQKRKESDFFHAIPYTRTCVYVSFLSAALAFIWSIQLTCGVVAGILWSMIPRLTADIGGMFAYMAISMLAAAMLSAFMMLALTVSGTGGSCFLLFFLFAGFVRVVCAIILGCLDSIFFIDANEMWNVSFLAPQWLLPVNILYYWMAGQEATTMLYSLANILYSLIVTVGLFALSGLLYNRRKSEMAGNPAPGIKTQALFRILFTSLAVLLIPLLIIGEGFDAAILLVLIALVLLVYFLYELITTKRPKNLLRILPGLGIVAGVCIAFILGFGVYRTCIVNEKITADDIKWVSMESNGFAGGTYQDRLSDTLRTRDAEMRDIIADCIAVSQKYERDGNIYDSDFYNRYDTYDVVVRLKGGRTLYLRIAADADAQEKIHARFADLLEVKDILYLLPTDTEVQSVGMKLSSYHYVHSSNREQFGLLLSTFRAEFEALTDEQKAQVMAPALNASDRESAGYDYEIYPEKAGNGTMLLSLSGRVVGKHFYNEYIITDDLPETRRIATYLWGASQVNGSHIGVDDILREGTTTEVLAVLNESAEDPAFGKKYAYTKGSFTLSNPSGNGVGDMDRITNFVLNSKDYARFAEILSEACAITATTKEQDFVLTENIYCLDLYSEYWDDGENLYFGIHGLFEFSPEALDELVDILNLEK